MYFKHNTTGRHIGTAVYDALTEAEKNNYSLDYAISSNEDLVFDETDEERIDILTGSKRETIDCDDMD